MRREDGVMGGEYSAHYCFKENYYSDSGLIPFLLVLELLSKADKPFSKVVEEFNIYVREPQINLEIHDIPKALQAIKQKYSDGMLDELDGVTVWYPDWWFVVRGSNTEPVLRVNIEANTKEILEEKKREMLDFIKTLE